METWIQTAYSHKNSWGWKMGGSLGLTGQLVMLYWCSSGFVKVSLSKKKWWSKLDLTLRAGHATSNILIQKIPQSVSVGSSLSGSQSQSSWSKISHQKGVRTYYYGNFKFELNFTTWAKMWQERRKLPTMGNDKKEDTIEERICVLMSERNGLFLWPSLSILLLFYTTTFKFILKSLP